MRNSKLLRGICYVLIPVMILLIVFSFFYQYYDNYKEEYYSYYINEANLDTEYSEEVELYLYDGDIATSEKEMIDLLNNMTFMNYCAPVLIPLCTLFLLVMAIFLVISIGHTKRKR